MKASLIKNIRSVLAAVLVVVTLAGLACGTSARPTPGAAVAPVPTATPKPTSAARLGEVTLRVGVNFISSPPDPISGGGLHAIQRGVAETLFKLGSKDLRPEPWLATAARQVDERTWEISLRQGVKFHNGTLMDAAAVKASLERAITKSPVAKGVLDIAQIEVKDSSTLIIATNNPSPILPGILAEPSSAIVDAAAAEAMGDAFAEKPVLTGPFKVERFQLDRELVAVRHTKYWGTPPLVDRVIVTYIPDDNSRTLALQSGDIDISIILGPESAVKLKDDPKVLVRSAEPVGLNFMYLNHRREPWKDLRVRQAIALAIDDQALVKGVMLGFGAAATGPVPPVVLRCNQLRGHPFDPAKARALLTEAGYQDRDGDGYVDKEGKALTMTLLTYRQRPELVPMAEIIQSSLKAIGVKVEVRVVEQINAALQQGDWDGGMYSNNMANTGDPYWALSQFFATGGSGNRGGFSSPQADELTRQLAVATDRQAREQLACAASQVVTDEVAIVPLVYWNVNHGVSRKVVGLDEVHPHFLYLIDSKIGKR